MRKLPDFQQSFFDYFGNIPRKVTYEIRDDSNRYHDQVYFSSLIHDAIFRRKNLLKRGKLVSIPIDRDCWELLPSTGELFSAIARITLHGVEDIEWYFDHDWDLTSNDAELEIDGLWIDGLNREAGDIIPVILEGHGWNCKFWIHEPEMKIRVKDLEIPHSWF